MASKLAAREVKVIETEVARIDGQLDDLRLTFTDGSTLQRQAIFHAAPTAPSTALAAQLGCTLYDDGGVQIDEFKRTTVAGVFAAGDMARQPAVAQSVTLVSVGAGPGSKRPCGWSKTCSRPASVQPSRAEHARPARTQRAEAEAIRTAVTSKCGAQAHFPVSVLGQRASTG